jgi:hypothetical protein
MTPQDFVTRWAASSAAERSNKDSFLNELCDVLGIQRPDPATGDPERDQYVFERDAVLAHEAQNYSVGKIDLYKRGCFILEAKQGSGPDTPKTGSARRGTPGWNIAMHDAFGQALGYARTFDAPPPFIVTCDIGYCFDLYATFDGSTDYRPFPNALHNRLFLKDLELAEHQATLRVLFTDPASLDPAKHAAKVTREVAGHLAELARKLEQDGHGADEVARFLMRCIFTMFAEDVGLLPERLFADALAKRWIDKPSSFPGGCQSLWAAMNVGAQWGLDKVLQFNGGLFARPLALSLDAAQLKQLLEAAECDWSEVEPAIFGTLLERALDPKERHKLGAHFTPRAYVERLVRPTVEDPLRAEWDLVRAEVRHLVEGGRAKQEAEEEKARATKKVAEARHHEKQGRALLQRELDRAAELIRGFHARLCKVRVLDPACGSGNFLYVSLDLLKRLEDEVLELLQDIDEGQHLLSSARVGPQQFLGIEVKPWAKEIAELVLWIGYLQWHYRRHGKVPPKEPVLQDYKNIECRDAVLAWDSVEPFLDENGKSVTRWDGESYKEHPATGELIPDETKRLPSYRYINPRIAEWPQADYIVGNPPYVANKGMRLELGDGYVEALRQADPDVPDTCDYVMHWWDRAAERVRRGEATRFGFITTKSITQTFNRQVVVRHLQATPPLSLAYAIPNHPWPDASEDADVRIAVTVGVRGIRPGVLEAVAHESISPQGEPVIALKRRTGVLNPDLSIGVDVTEGTVPLQANRNLCLQGCKLVGAGFQVSPDERRKLLAGARKAEQYLPRYVTGSDLTKKPNERYVIDFFGLTAEEASAAFPSAFQVVLTKVKPERDHNRRPVRRRNWWLFGENAPKLRRACSSLRRFIATSEVAKHRVFVFLDLPGVLADGSLAAIAHDDAFVLGVVSSSLHVTWALATGGRLGVGDDPRYQNGPCFLPFPFPDCGKTEKARIRAVAERLDAHRRARQEECPNLSLTEMYNVLEKLHSGEALTAKEKSVHEQGLVSVLKEIHDELDAAVFDAYGWPQSLSDTQILERLFALNAERAVEEEQGLIRWLRPEFQKPKGAVPLKQVELAVKSGRKVKAVAAQKPAWPKTLPERIAFVRDLLHRSTTSTTSQALASAFRRAPVKDVELALQSLAALGLALAFDAGKETCWRAASRTAA